jgi:hypothetical protein
MLIFIVCYAEYNDSISQGSTEDSASITYIVGYDEP